MVTRVYPGTADFENLSRLRTETSQEANSFDFSRVVVNKPWGYEYLWFQNSSVAVWMLHLSAGSATSLHCHARKRTSLIVMDGEVECSTFENRYTVTAGKAVVLEPCVFHSTRAKSEGGAFVMEVETPPLKGDLLRYRDDFGRAGKGYEASKQYSTEFANYRYHPFNSPADASCFKAYQGVTLDYCSVRNSDELATVTATPGLVIPFLGRLIFDRELVADIGEAVPTNEIPLAKCPKIVAPVELLRVCPTSSPA